MKKNAVLLKKETTTSDRLRTVLFAAAVIALFLLWGGRVYADNVISVNQGESIEVTLDEAACVETPYAYANLQVRAYKEGADNSKINVSVLDAYPNSVMGYGGSGNVTKIRITVAADAEPGTYSLQYLKNPMDFGASWVVKGSPASFTVVGEESGDTENIKEPEERKTKKEPVYVPKTAEEIYMDTLEQWYPAGFDFIKTGNGDCMNFISQDNKTSSLYQAGVLIADFQFVTADGTAKKILLANPKVIDGISYPSFWVNVNDGQDVTLQISEEHRKKLIEMGITQIYLNEKLIVL